MKDKFTKLNGHITSLEAEFLGNKFNVSDYQVSFLYLTIFIKLFNNFKCKLSFGQSLKKFTLKSLDKFN